MSDLRSKMNRHRPFSTDKALELFHSRYDEFLKKMRGKIIFDKLTTYFPRVVRERDRMWIV